MKRLTHLSLFSGIGGLDLAAEWAGFETVGQCEWADYPIKILEKHWPNVPRWRDVKTLTKEEFYERTGLETVTVISGGFPCQPHSVIGKRKGDEDKRHLWPEFLRVIRELQPSFVVGENVIGILSTIHEQVCTDLENEGYQVRTFCIPASVVGAPHERYRTAIVGIAENEPGLQTHSGTDTERGGRKTRQCAVREPWLYLPGTYWTAHQPPICGMDDGFSKRLDKGYKERMMALGNAVVPQQFYPIFSAIREVIEHER